MSPGVYDFAVAIGGAAGQGIAVPGNILARTMVRRGLQIYAYNAYQSIIRGGHIFLTVRIRDGEVPTHGDKLDLLTCLNQDTMDRHLRLLAPGCQGDLQQRRGAARRGGGRGAALSGSSCRPDRQEPEQGAAEHRLSGDGHGAHGPGVPGAGGGAEAAVRSQGGEGRRREPRRRPGRFRLRPGHLGPLPGSGPSGVQAHGRVDRQ